HGRIRQPHLQHLYTQGGQAGRRQAGECGHRHLRERVAVRPSQARRVSEAAALQPRLPGCCQMTLPASSATHAPHALRLSNVSRSFGALKAVDDVDLQVATGTRHAIIGPNGAGKSTLFALISGELALSSGRVALMDADVSTWSA